MRTAFVVTVACALACFMFCGADAAKNHNGKFALHVGGLHGESPIASCDFVMTDCTGAVTHVVSPGGPDERWDIYVIAMDVNGIAGARYGLRTEQPVGLGLFFYGWTDCSVFAIDTSGWPGGGEGISQAWSGEQPGPHVTMGILDVYLYPGSNAKLCTTADPRVGYAEFCDGTEPLPLCNKHYPWVHKAFGCVGFNRLGYNPCSVVPTKGLTWGALKGLYR